MNVKYQIFISSTYDDLHKERQQVIKATLEMGHIPVGMEMFSAADDEQWKIIARQIDECDYYVVIVAHRYGSIIRDISYTEKEYDYAIQKGVPIIGFIIDDKAPWPSNMVDSDTNKKQSLTLFKEKIKLKPVGFWSSADDLYGKYSIALMKLITTNPRPGWARVSEMMGPQDMIELSRLSRENAALREQLENERKKESEDSIAELQSIARALFKNKYTIKLWLKDSRGWSSGPEISLLRFFVLLAPELIIEKSTTAISSFLGSILANKRAVRLTWPVPSNSIKSCLGDLMTLGLVEPSHRKHPVSDKEEYWSLTEKGRKTYGDLNRRLLEEGKGAMTVLAKKAKEKSAT